MHEDFPLQEEFLLPYSENTDCPEAEEVSGVV